jgi:hypothetical protein
VSKRLEHIYFTGLWFLVVTSTNKGLNFVLVACCAMLLLALPNLSRIKVGAAALILTVSLLGISEASIILQSPELDFSHTTAFTYVFYIFYLITLLIATNLSVVKLSESSEALIYLFAFVYLLQFLFWGASGNILDINETLFGQTARQDPAFWNLPRFSTLFEEPSTFGAVLLALVFVVQLRNPWSWAVFLGLALAVSTFSFFVFFSTLVILAIWIVAAVFRRMASAIISVIVIVAGVAVTINYLLPIMDTVTFQNSSTNLVIRMALLDYAFDRDGANILLGSGFFGEDPTIKYFTDPRTENGRLAAVNDLGTVVYFFVEFGFLGVATLFLFILFASRHLDRKIIPFFWCMFFTKLSILHPLFFIVLLNPKTLGRRPSSEQGLTERAPMHLSRTSIRGSVTHDM